MRVQNNAKHGAWRFVALLMIWLKLAVVSHAAAPSLSPDEFVGNAPGVSPMVGSKKGMGRAGQVNAPHMMSSTHMMAKGDFEMLKAQQRAEQAARAPGVAPGVPNENEVDEWLSTVTLSPTPLYSSFSKIDPVFMTDDGTEDDEDFLPNIAVNSSCVLSSSSTSSGTFCRLSDDESQRIATASEDDPFIIVDLENLFFVDHLSFAVNVDKVSAYNKLSVMCLNDTHADLTRTDAMNLPASWQKTVLQDSGNYSFHVHSPCQIVRIQRKSFGPLVIAGLKIYGARIRNRELINCMTDHGQSVCSGHGQCVEASCDCAFGYSGEKCSDFFLGRLIFSSVQAAVFVTAFVAIALYYRRFTEKCTNVDDAPTGKTDYQPVDPQRGFDETMEEPLPLLRASSTPASLSRWTPERQGLPSGSLHLLFASPLVMAVPSKDGSAECFRPITGLDIKREYAMLNQSLKRAAGPHRAQIPVTVSSATIDQFHSLMTLGEAKCIHFSGHCTKDFLAFEDHSGQLHRIKMPMLRGLLRSTVTPKSFQSLKLVVLNACNSENAGFEFVLAGVPNVIAYRGKVRDSTAATFTQALYLSLACGRNVRDAFQSAKEAVSSSPTVDATEINQFLLLPEKGNHTDVLWDESHNPIGTSPEWPLSKDMRSLPPLAEDFLGRHIDTFQILEAITHRKRRLIILNGPDGSGKKQLALAVAHHLHLRRDENNFTGGIFFARKTCSGSLDSVVDAVCKSLSCAMAIPAELSTDGKIDALTEGLASRSGKTILILDSVPETEEVVSRFLSVLLEDIPDLSILITSRTAFQLPLDVSLQHYNVGPLNAGDSALLLIRHLKRKLLVGGQEMTLKELSQHPIVAGAQGSPMALIRAARKLSAAFPSNSAIDLDHYDVTLL